MGGDQEEHSKGKGYRVPLCSVEGQACGQQEANWAVVVGGEMKAPQKWGQVVSFHLFLKECGDLVESSPGVLGIWEL